MKKILLTLLSSSALLWAATITIAPKESIAKKIVKARNGDTLLVASGTYKETIILKSGITLKAQERGKVILSGDGREATVRMKPNTTVDGLIIQNGGNGVLTQSNSATITNCIIRNNRRSGILAVKTLPSITNSIIENNGAYGIQGTDIENVTTKLSHLTILKNRNSGINIITTTPIEITNSIILKNSNKALSGTLEKLEVSNNIIYPMQPEFADKNKEVKVKLTSKHGIKGKYFPIKDSAGERNATDGRNLGADWEK